MTQGMKPDKKPSNLSIWLIVVYLLICFFAGFYYFSNV